MNSFRPPFHYKVSHTENQLGVNFLLDLRRLSASFLLKFVFEEELNGDFQFAMNMLIACSSETVSKGKVDRKNVMR